MRLSQSEAQQIRDSILHFHPPQGTRLLLYGSRVHDHLRGGDIDLALVIPSQYLVEWKKKKLELLIEMKARIGEQKIDLSILDETMVANDPFYIVALKGAVALFPT